MLIHLLPYTLTKPVWSVELDEVRHIVKIIYHSNLIKLLGKKNKQRFVTSY